MRRTGAITLEDLATGAMNHDAERLAETLRLRDAMGAEPGH